MNLAFLPKPKEYFPGNDSFHLHEGLNVFVNKAKVQDHVMHLFGFLWRNFKINMKITAIRDRDFKEEYENGLFLYMTSRVELSPEFPEIFTKALERLDGEGYALDVAADSIFIASRTMRGFFNGVLTFQQAGESFRLVKDEETKKNELFIPSFRVHDQPDLEMRAVHLDLKHQLHSLDYLKDYMRFLARFKINAIVWEWEDKFPYKKRPEIKHPLAFNHQETVELLELCHVYGIESIPLVQTYGHLEFVLKHEKYQHLKESKDAEEGLEHTLDICALHDETMPLIQDLIADLVSYHPSSRYIHIGGDEVYTLGTCKKCKAFIKEQGDGDEIRGKSKLYVMHMNRVAKIVKGFGKIPMMWHDYLLKYPACLDEMDKDVVVVYWMYGKDHNPADFSKDISMFKTMGFKVLVASSVNSDFQYALPNYDIRIQNIYELNKALVQTSGGNVGSLATNWAGCRAPIETSILATLFFAESSWNVGKKPYSKDELSGFGSVLLRSVFGIQEGHVKKHALAFPRLMESTTLPQKAAGLGTIDAMLGQSIDDWEKVLQDSSTGKNIASNIIHGLKLQRLKVQLFIFAKDIEHLFDQEDLPPLNEIKSTIKDLERLSQEFELCKYKTKELYEKVMYDEEVSVELALRFGKPLDYIKKNVSLLKDISLKIEDLIELIEKTNFGTVFPKKEEEFPAEIASFSRQLIASKNGEKNPPGIEKIDRFIANARTFIGSSKEKVKDIVTRILEEMVPLRDVLDNFLLETARVVMEPNLIGKF
nr:family 20 glycosylhydrolase [Candidatus Sigynarchaeota archaeon]